MTTRTLSMLLLATVATFGERGSARSARAGAVAGRVEVTRDGKAKADGSRVVVYLEGVPGGDPTAPATRPQIRQRDKQFVPGLSVVVRGTTVDFPNDDKIFHNVFSVSSAAKFDLGLYKSGSSKSVTFNRPGVVDVYCNIHPEMVARVLVVDTRFYAETGTDGRFRIAGVPPGTYRIVAWHPSGGESRGEVTVKAGGTAEVELSVAEQEVSTRHKRKDGTPYGRYK